MKAVTIDRYGPPEVLTVTERDRPRPGPGELLLRVAAVAVNPVDLAVRRGDIPSPVLPAVVGWDVSGTVVETGPGVSRFQLGDRVVAAHSPLATGIGVSAAYVALDETLAAPAPASVPLEHAAALPLAALTAEQALSQLGPDFSGRLLVAGAAGAVGGFLVQLAALRGRRPAGLARASDAPTVATLGAAEVFSSPGTLPTGAFDAVIDAAGLPATIAAVRDGGRYLSLTPFAVPEPERSIAVEIYGVRTDGTMLDTLARHVDQGHLTLRIAHVLPFEDAPLAHALLEGGGTRGKILLTPGD
ncbi:NADPH:quinone reductase-like Zn-dependent oxidoreductase [Kitasatospora sp. GAS204A]|uniref:NADP-dependent oxidoreductase n=1 Tax=unclassified Kitasatospora TaxID=2633591 RepID=UPI00247373F1|nr:NADP-dependent oxidoreductase [Kitasatospora sp. GAS204B]MDH6120958.1 NADPH:quinone reductase-like Zn-dependent oxidoreductase [Kitasatospora sp. GAS204B]